MARKRREFGPLGHSAEAANEQRNDVKGAATGRAVKGDIEGIVRLQGLDK